MPLLSDNCLARIKAAAEESIVDIIGSYVPLKLVGRERTACCPFHDERTPSFKVSTSKKIYKCFGCGASGDAIEFVQSYLKKTFPEAAEIIANKLSIPLEYADAVAQPPANSPVIFPTLSPPGKGLLQWFLDRGIQQETVQAFGIAQTVTWMPKARQEVLAAAYPYVVDGELRNLKLRAKDKDFMMIKGAPLSLFNLDACAGAEDVFLVEGEPDAMILWQVGFRNVVSVPNGASNRQMMNLIAAFAKGRRRFYFAGDMDSAGLTLRQAVAEVVPPNIFYRVNWPLKDANDVYLQAGGADAIRQAIADAEPPQIDPADVPASFPFDVFDEEIAANFREIAKEYSIPPDYLGTTALFTISALSGSMYETELNGAIKNIVYAMLVGPSGVGKSPAYDLLCGNIIGPLEKSLFEKHEHAVREWNEAAAAAKTAKPPQAFTVPRPVLRMRLIKGGTTEGIQRHAMHSAAGFGIYYDEGGRMLGSPNAYKKDTSSTDFWNEIWSGRSFFEVRAEEGRERFVASSSISVLMGMQADRIGNYFTADAIASGLTARFLITSSDYVQLNTNVDHFSPRRQLSADWAALVRFLFLRGAQDFFKGDNPTVVPFQPNAAQAYNQISQKLIGKANTNRSKKLIGDVSQLMVSYDSKLYAYFGRFMLILAILEDARNPCISLKHVYDAEKLYHYYRKQAQKTFDSLNKSIQEGMTENQIKLLEALPDYFTSTEAESVCVSLGFTRSFFFANFRRVFSKTGAVKKIKKGEYEKCI